MAFRVPDSCPQMVSEYDDFVEACRRHSNSSLVRIAELSRTGNARSLKNAVDRYLKQLAPKMVAVEKVRRRLAQTQTAPPSRQTCFELAKRLDLYARSNEVVPVHGVPRSDGSARAVYNFGFENRARQQVVKLVLEATFNPRHAHGGVRGQGVASLSEVIKDSFEDGYKWVWVNDIRRCFPSIHPRAVQAALSFLPTRVTERVVLARSYQLQCDDERLRYSYGHPDGTGEAQRGLPQGSATSNLALAHTLEHLTRHLIRDEVKLGFYVDDIIVLGRQRKDVVSTTRNLEAVLKQPHVGPLLFQKWAHDQGSIRRADWGFDYLKRNYRMVDDQSRGPRRLQVRRLRHSFSAGLEYDFLELCLDRNATREECEQMSSRIHGYFGAYSDIENSRLWRDLRLSLLQNRQLRSEPWSRDEFTELYDQKRAEQIRAEFERFS